MFLRGFQHALTVLVRGLALLIECGVKERLFHLRVRLEFAQDLGDERAHLGHVAIVRKRAFEEIGDAVVIGLDDREGVGRGVVSALLAIVF
ncbi:MAG: hypothetical protein NVS3B17_17740 [Vulcanimicrobiaceae bacterium]